MANWKYALVIVIVVFLTGILFIGFYYEQQNEKERLNEQIRQKEIERDNLIEQTLKQKQEQDRLVWQKKEQDRQIQEQERQNQELQRKLQEQTQSEEKRMQGIFDNTKRLYEEYKWKLDLVTEIQTRTDALGTSASRDMYIEWIRRNNEAISAGEELASYITENRDILDNKGTIKNWASDTLILIAKNKVVFERDNQGLIEYINKKR